MSAATNDKAYRELAELVWGLQKRIDGLSTAQLAHSSLENTGINTYDENGQIGGVYGRLPDGTFGSATLSGPKPPTPSRPTAEPIRGVGLKIAWGGVFAVATDIVPLEGGRLEVYVTTSSNITGATVPRTTIESPRGGETTLSVSYDQDYYVAFAFRAASGKLSDVSEVVGPVRVARASAEDLDIDFDALRGTKVWYGPDEPVTDRADLWLQNSVMDGQTVYIGWRYNPETSQWEQLADQKIVQALKDAADAAELANQAGIAALAAQGVANQGAEDAAGALTAASAAQTAAAEAQTKANEAAQAALDAAGTANTAQGTADAAVAAAAAAQDAAEAADAAALAAAGLANSKGQVYYQASAPSPGDINSLWIDIDDGNQPYRYVSGAWSAVENASIQAAADTAGAAQTRADQAVADAAAAQAAADAADIAAAAAQTKANEAAQAASEAAAAALAAHDTANAANTLADQAKTTADSKITVYRQAAAPTGGTYKPQGDLWIDSDDGKLYVATTTAGGWTETTDARLATALSTANSAAGVAAAKTTVFAQTAAPSTTGRTVGDVWLDTDDANKWYDWVGGATPKWQVRQWGAGAISATARQLGAITTFRQATAPASGMLAGDFWIDSDDNVIYRYQDATAGWVKSQDTNINVAIQNAATAQSTADGKVRIFPQASPPLGLVAGDVGDMWIDTDDSNVTYTWDGTAWLKRQIGSGAIVPKSLIASDVVATGTISAALFEAIMVLVTEIIAGNPLGTHARMTPTGFRVYVEDPIDGVPNEVVRLGSGGDVLGVTAADGTLAASIDESGRIAGRALSITNRSETRFGGQTLDEMDWERPWGLVGKGEVVTSPAGNYWSTPRTNGEIGLAEFAFTAHPGRSYELTSEPFEMNVLTGDTAYLRVRHTTDGATPTITSPKLREYVVAPIRTGFSGSRAFAALFDGPTGVGAVSQTYRLLLTYGTGNGSTGAQCGVLDRFRFSVRDVGPERPNIAVYSAGGGTVTAGQNVPPPPPATAKVTRTDTWELNWSRSWRQESASSFRTDVGSSMYQGYGDSYNGIQGGAFAWNDVVPALAGAEINKVELFLHCEHAWYNTGLTAQIGRHGVKDLPTVFPGQAVDWFHLHFGKPEGKWIVLPTPWYSAIQSGSTRGITLYANTTDAHFYGRFSGAGVPTRPQIRITYTK